MTDPILFKRALTLLKRHEWCDHQGDGFAGDVCRCMCPECGGCEDAGHDEGCELDAVLRGGL